MWRGSNPRTPRSLLLSDQLNISMKLVADAMPDHDEELPSPPQTVLREWKTGIVQQSTNANADWRVGRLPPPRDNTRHVPCSSRYRPCHHLACANPKTQSKRCSLRVFVSAERGLCYTVPISRAVRRMANRGLAALDDYSVLRANAAW